MALKTALIIYMLKGAWAAYVKRRRHETRGLRREKRVVLKGGSAPRSADEDPSARRIAAVAAAGGPVVCRLSSDIDRTQAGNPFMSLSFLYASMTPRQSRNSESSELYLFIFICS